MGLPSFDFNQIISNPYAPYVFIGLLALITLIVIIVFWSGGIIRDLFRIIYLVGLYFVYKFISPLLTPYILMIPFVNANPLFVQIVTIVAILVIWLLGVVILNLIFRKLFSVAIKTCKIFGFIISIPMALLVNVLVIDLVSPHLLQGGEKLTNAPYISVYVEKVIDPFKDTLYINGIPSSYEAIMINNVYEEKDERIEAYNAFKTVNSYYINGNEYLNSLNNAETISFNKDLTTVVKVVNNNSNETTKLLLAIKVTEYIANYQETVTYIGSNRSSFIEEIGNLPISEETLELAKIIFIE